MAESRRNRYNSSEEGSKLCGDARVRTLGKGEFFKIETRAFRLSFSPKKHMQGGFDFWNLWE